MTTPLRWGARLVGGLGVAMWSFALIADLFAEEASADVEDGVAVVLATFVVANVIAFAVAFAWERTAGIALVVLGVSFSVFAITTAGHDHWLAALVSGGPFAASGVLFYMASRRRDRRPSAAA